MSLGENKLGAPQRHITLLNVCTGEVQMGL